MKTGDVVSEDLVKSKVSDEELGFGHVSIWTPANGRVDLARFFRQDGRPAWKVVAVECVRGHI